ncbi:MAG: hypothetical protein ACTSRZ_00550 [Promethearchaeota archaeon]
MIKQLYIMKMNGILLYSKNYTDEKYDDDILVGFFASIANFSREALNTVVQNLNLGMENKLVLCPIVEEGILSAAIVSSNDSEDLVYSILKDITQDFIDEYGPHYIAENINQSYIDKIVDNNLGGKTVASKFKRFILCWLILGPLSVIFMQLSAFTGQMLFDMMGLYQPTFNFETVLSTVVPGFFLISTIVSLELFILPNLINGFVMFHKKIMYFNTILYIIITMLGFLLGGVYYMIIILGSYLPLVLIISIFFTAQGYNLASKKKLNEK